MGTIESLFSTIISAVAVALAGYIAYLRRRVKQSEHEKEIEEIKKQHDEKEIKDFETYNKEEYDRIMDLFYPDRMHKDK